MYESTHDNYDTALDYEKFSGSVTLVLEPTGVVGLCRHSYSNR